MFFVALLRFLWAFINVNKYFSALYLSAMRRRFCHFFGIFAICLNFNEGAINNVLFITIDDLRTEIGAYHGVAITQNMDKIAETGVTFQKAYSQMALCAPSRNSFLTSRRPDTLQLYDFYSYWRDVAGNFTTLPQYLKQHGYHTQSIGKIFHPGESSNFTDDFPLSWTNPAWHPPTARYKDEPVCHSRGRWTRSLVCPVNIAEQPGNTLPDIESTERAIAYLEERKGKDEPFFLALGYYKPHVPFKFPRKYLDMYPLESIKLPSVRSKPEDLPTVAWAPWNDIRHRDDIAALNLTYPFGNIPDDMARKIRQSYYASVSYIDDLLGRVLHSLKANGFEKNTVVVLMGDHGWSLGEHGEWAKFSNYEIALKTPLIINCPKLTRGASIAQPVELLDVFPTLVDLLGLPALSKCSGSRQTTCTEGKSLLPLLLGRPVAEGYAFSQYPRPGVFPSRHPNSDSPMLEEITVMGYSVRTQQYRYTLWVSWKPFTPDWTDVKGAELYNHVTDPEENINLAGRPELTTLESRLRGILIQQFSKEESPGKFKVSQTLQLESDAPSAKRVPRLDKVPYAIVVDLNQVIHETNPNFLSFALDTSFVRDHLHNFTEPQWQKFTELSRSLSPAILRLGGTDADRLKFSEKSENGFVTLSENDWATFNVFVERANLTLLFDFNVLLRDKKSWDSGNAEEILKFSRKSGFKISHFQLGNEPNSFPHVFNISLPPSQLAGDFVKLRNILNSSDFYSNSVLIGPDVTNPRVGGDEDEKQTSSRTSSMRHAESSVLQSRTSSKNATRVVSTTPSSVLTSTKSSEGSTLTSTSTAVPVTVKKIIRKTSDVTTSTQIPSIATNEPSTKTMTTFSVTSKTVTPARRKRDTSPSRSQMPPEKYLRQFLESTENFTLNAISWHHYYLNGRTATVDDFTNPKTLDSFARNVEIIRETVRDFSHDVPIWLSETGSAYGGGAANLSDKYVSVFLLLDKLGVSAKLGLDLVIRQSLYGGHYALLDREMGPNPDFWVSLMFKKLVGSRVYSVDPVLNDEHLRFYAHNVIPSPCLANSSFEASLVVFGMNLGQKEKALDVKGTTELVHCASYIFTPPGGNLQAGMVLLNGKTLDWAKVRTRADQILVDFASVDGVSVIPAYSVAFFIFSSPQF